MWLSEWGKMPNGFGPKRRAQDMAPPPLSASLRRQATAVPLELLVQLLWNYQHFVFFNFSTAFKSEEIYILLRIDFFKSDFSTIGWGWGPWPRSPLFPAAPCRAPRGSAGRCCGAPGARSSCGANRCRSWRMDGPEFLWRSFGWTKIVFLRDLCWKRRSQQKLEIVGWNLLSDCFFWESYT